MTESISPSTTAPASSWRRRRWLTGALAGAAVLGGVGLAWWQADRSRKISETVNPDFWRLTFIAPDGASLPMSALRGKPLLLNFWATWCPPCVEELPLLSRFYQANSVKGWQVLGLAVDQAAPVQRFLAQTPVTFPVALAGLPGIEISRALGNTAGGLPFTAVLGSDGSVRHRKIGQVSADDLRLWTSET
jgi:thiol-disulfide isomerase/thioredoxin